ncbi:phosphate regulon sensor histidine kinase PhoR [Aestuariibacter salexigens]|uniref:phosphate regulon sensor histidine kinase PhoR n=1 Tax=Aestuariibacter salexigens TaxID=226010 RepID=UPI0004111FB6|nr:phosphate regulon sensor histidine kinase PhoR [Aestuariibacter salexigens]
MHQQFSLFKSLLRLIGVATLVLAFGALTGEMLLSIAVGALTVLTITYWNLYRLNHWLWHSRRLSPPKLGGIWEHIYDGIYYLQRRNRTKRKKLGAVVKRFREGSEAVPDAAVVVDNHGCIEWCNRLATIELGLKWPDDAGRRIDNFIRHPKFKEYFHAGQFDFPIEVPSPTNLSKIFEYRIMPYGGDHLLLIARDVTRLTQLENMRKDFVANVSHELKTPLTVLNGYLEVLPSDAGLPKGFKRKAYKEMAIQTRRMQSLVEQLLVLSRIEASEERISETMVDVPAVLNEIQIEANTLNKEKSHEITLHIEPQLKVYGVETELRSAFSNLIFNAIHYTPAKGKIDVYWHRSGDKARFAVKDNGDGIAEKHLNRLTERFYRVDTARSRKTGGSGLGLAIVKHVLSHHNTKLHIRSKFGQGSEFSFSFPEELTVAEPRPEVNHS